MALLILAGAKGISAVKRLLLPSLRLLGEPLRRFTLAPFAYGCVFVAAVLGGLTRLPRRLIGGLLYVTIVGRMIYLLWRKQLQGVSHRTVPTTRSALATAKG